MANAKVVIYSKDQCPYCLMAKELLQSRNITFQEFYVDRDQSKLEEMMRLSDKRTVPQIFINDKSIGGYDDLAALVKAGKLDELLK
jgi:glutaredoxin 3